MLTFADLHETLRLMGMLFSVGQTEMWKMFDTASQVENKIHAKTVSSHLLPRH